MIECLPCFEIHVAPAPLGDLADLLIALEVELF
jgi:hypothetical protein